MHTKIKKINKKDFDSPAISIDKVADADTVVGKSIITVSGAQIIPLSSVTAILKPIRSRTVLNLQAATERLLLLNRRAFWLTTATVADF